MRSTLNTLANIAKIAGQRMIRKKGHETSNSEIYDQIAETYDHDYGHIFGRVKKEIRVQLSELALKEPTIIDVGTGTGENILLAKKVFGSLGSVYGVDISEKMLAIAKEKHPDMHTVQASALSLSSLIQAEADLVFIHFLLSYVSADQLLPQVAARLKSGGYVSIASSLGSSWPRGQGIGKRLGMGPQSVVHYIPKNSAELRSKIVKLGFKEVDSVEIRKRMIFENIHDVYRFGFEQGWVYQLFEFLGCAGQPEKFAREWGHAIPYDDELHIHIGLYRKL